MTEKPRDYYLELTRENARLNREEAEAGKVCLDSRPLFFGVDLIGACNMKPPCRMCDIYENKAMLHPGLPYEELMGYGEYLDRCTKIVNCSIGEPLLYPRFTDLIRHAHSRGKMIGVNSNGLALSPEMADELVKYPDSLDIIFSVDAATAETYAKIRGNEFERVCRNIAYYCRRRRELGVPLETRAGFCFMPMACNRHELPRYFELAAELGVDVVELRSLNRIPGNKVVRRGDFTFDYYEQMLSDEALEECRLEAVELSRKYGVPFDCQYEISEDYSYDFYRPPELSLLPTPCFLPWRFMLPFNDGRTLLCCHIQESFGDWREEGLDGIWNGEKARQIRAALLEGELPPICLNYPSCPVVRYDRRKNREKRAARMKDAFRVDEGHYRMAVASPDFVSLITSDVYAEETDSETGEKFRWLGRAARFQLINPFPGEPHVIQLRIRNSKPDSRSAPVRLSAWINGVELGGCELARTTWESVAFDCAGSSEDELSLEIRCANPWTPREHFQTDDRRLLGVRLSEISLRRGRAKKPGLWQKLVSAGRPAK